MSINLTAESINESMQGDGGPRATFKLRVSKSDNEIIAVGAGFLAARTRTSLSIGQAARATLLHFLKSDCDEIVNKISEQPSEVLEEEIAFSAPTSQIKEIRNGLAKYNHPLSDVARTILRTEMLKQIAVGIEAVEDGEFQHFLDLI